MKIILTEEQYKLLIIESTLKDTLKELKKSISRSWLKKNWVVLAGQPSPETSENVYPELVAFAKSKGALVAVDASGEVLAKLLKEVKPDLIKPNQKLICHLNQFSFQMPF